MKTIPVVCGTKIIEANETLVEIESLTIEQRLDRIERILNIGVNSEMYNQIVSYFA